MIENNRNNEQIYGRNDMIMLDPNNKIYGSLGIADKYVMKTEEGTMLVLKNPKSGKFGDVLTEFNIYGRSEQNKTTGKNLLKYPYVEANRTSFGIKFTDNKDGSITISGTSTETAYYNLYSNIDGKRLTLASGTYKLVVKGRSKCNVFINNGVSSAQNEGTFTITDGNNEAWCFIQVLKGVTVDETIYPMIQLASITDESYEPYTGGIPSPSPDYPQEIKSVGDSGSIELNVMGANVLEGTKLGVKLTNGGITYTTYENGILITGTATSDVYIKIHDDKMHPLTHGIYYITARGISPSISVDFFYTVALYNDVQNMKVILNKDVEYSINLKIPKGATLNTTVQVSLTKSKITSYEPYQEEQTVALPYILNAIPVSSGGNYTDQSGQQWICDEVDLHRGVKVQRVKVKELSPDDRWAHTKLNSGNNNFQIRILNADVAADGKPCFCNILLFKNVLWNDSIQNLPKIYANNKEITVSFPPSSEYSSLEALKQLLTNVKSVIYYALATPIETPLTTAEIADYKALSIKIPTTIIENNYNTWMKATYKSTESV